MDLPEVVTDVYYIAFPKDKPLPKAIVAVCYILEVLQTTLSTRDAFRNFATGWGNMIDLDAVGWLWFSVPVLGSVSAYLSHSMGISNSRLLSRPLCIVQYAAWDNCSMLGGYGS